MFKLSDTVITINAIDYAVSCYGCAVSGILNSKAYGLLESYDVPQQLINKLIEKKVTDVRFYTSQGFIEHGINERSQLDIPKMLQLVL
jgi:hypothetical protein